MVEVVRKRIAPKGPARPVAYAPRRFPDKQNSPPLLDDDTTVKLSDLRHAARYEHVANLVDLLFRRVGAGWTRSMAADAAPGAARAVADILGWDEARMAGEVAAYRDHLAREHAFRGVVETK
jgi:glycerol-3-phosphate dehydrogenase